MDRRRHQIPVWVKTLAVIGVAICALIFLAIMTVGGPLAWSCWVEGHCIGDGPRPYPIE